MSLRSPLSTAPTEARPLCGRALRLLLLPLLCAACSSLPPGVPTSYAPEDVPAAAAEARAELAEGESEVALARARIAAKTRGLSPEVRELVQAALEESAQRRIEELSAEGEHPDKLEDIFELELPRQLSVEAGMRAAELLFEQRERLKAFRLLQKIDAKYPQHAERDQASTLIFDIGKDFAHDDGAWLWIFKYRSYAPGVLEYLVLNHPSNPRGDEAYWMLADIYEGERSWSLAIQKHEDLLLWHPGSEHVPSSRAQIPSLRLDSLGSPEYDRTVMQRARTELERWLDDYSAAVEAGSVPRELLEQVERDLVDSLQRLADNDMYVARFYAKVESPYGARLHARRSVELAKDAGDPQQIAEAEALLAAVIERWGEKGMGKSRIHNVENPVEEMIGDRR